MSEPYYEDASVRLYHGRMEDVMQDFGEDEWADACITDPPYQETSLEWDRWVDGWPLIVSWHTQSMWCFGSMRMFTSHWNEFKGWKLAQDTVGEYEIDTMVWEKHNGTGFAKDRFRRVHEFAVQFYQGNWADAYHETPRVAPEFDRHDRVGVTNVSLGETRQHTGKIGANVYTDDGHRLARSVIRCPSVRRGIHRTQKPTAILDPLIRYSVPDGGVVLDPFAGSCSVAVAVRDLGRRAICIEAREDYCEAAAKRLSVPDLFGAVS